MAGMTNHRATTGSSEVYNPEATEFRIYPSNGRIAPDTANERNYHMHWLADSPRTRTSTTTAGTACTDTSGATASSFGSCVCGQSLCARSQLCLASKNLCRACPASYELTPLGCQCPLSHASAGGGPCFEVLASALQSVAAPSMSTSKAPNGYTYWLEVKLGTLPSHFFEAVLVAYAIDVAPSREALDFQSNCTREWTVGPAEATTALTYGAFDGPCTLTASQGEGEFIRRGAVGIYIKSVDPNGGRERVEWAWTIDVSLVFDATVIGMLSRNMDGEINRTMDAGGFSSTLTLYQSVRFIDVLPQPYALTFGDLVYVQHRLGQPSPELSLEVTAVYLASSQGADDRASWQGADDSSAIVRNITDQVWSYETGESEVRFVYVALRCERCMLHVISRVKFSRRLRGAAKGERWLSANSEPRYAVQSVFIGSVQEQATSTATATSAALATSTATPSTSSTSIARGLVLSGACTTSAPQIFFAAWLSQVATVLPAALS